MTTRPDVTRFLDAIWADGPHSLNYKTPGGPFIPRGFPSSPTELIDQAVEIGPDAHIWHGACPLIAPPSSGRGSEDDVAAVATLFADLDWASPAHKELDLPTETFVRAAVAELGEFAPSIIVNSGYGLQTYWLLDSPIDPERGRQLQQRMAARLAELGLVNERVDLASVLRLPGSVNIKIPEHPRLVEIERIELGWRFTPERLERYLPAASPFSRRGAGTRHHGSGTPTEEQRLLLDFITEHHGAQLGRIHGGVIEVTRPGKAVGDGISATIIVGNAGDALLTVFSPNWASIGCRPGEAARSWVLRDGELVPARDANVLEIELELDREGDDDEEPFIPAGEEGEDLDQPAAPAAANPGDYLTKKGLRVVALLHDIEGVLPLSTDEGGQIWRWSTHGLWRPDGARLVGLAVAQRLGNRTRGSHVANVELLVRVRYPRIRDRDRSATLNVANGILDWATGGLVGHDPQAYWTTQLHAPWQPDATCPTIDDWLDEVVEPDVVDLIWEIVGMCIYAGNPFHRAVLLLGSGRNGKGTLLRLIEALVGHEAISSVTPQQLVEDRFAAAQLFGKTANLAGDLDARPLARSDTFKMATGEDMMTAQRKYGQPFEMRNRATFLFSANAAPGSSDHTLGYGARWVIVPFASRTLTPEEEDKTLEPRMHLELAGALVRAVDGLRRAIGRGDYARPPAVIAATADYLRDSDPLRRFVDDCLEVTGDPHHDVARSAVVDAYRSWCQIEGARAVGSNRFWRELAALEPGIDTGTTAADRKGHRVGQTYIVKGVRSVTHPGVAL